MYITDEKGKWKIDGNVKMLIEPSDSYLAQRGKERLQQEERELLDSLIPSENEMLMAEVEIQTIELLMEVGLI